MSQIKKDLLEYLNTQGFANDGFGEPISRTALKVIDAFIQGAECNPNASPVDYYTRAHAFANTIRNVELKEQILCIPGLQVFTEYEKACKASWEKIEQDQERTLRKQAIAEGFQVLEREHPWVVQYPGENQTLRSLFFAGVMVGKGLGSLTPWDLDQILGEFYAYEIRQEEKKRKTEEEFFEASFSFNPNSEKPFQEVQKNV